MVQSIVANPHQTSPYRHGNILFASVATYKKNPPGIGRCLSQGAAVGLFLGFLSPVFGMLSHPENGYNFLLMPFLPLILAVGLAGRMPFWLLLPLALIINFPIAAFITDVLTKEDFPLRHISIGYLSLWAAFLLTRLRLPEAALSFIKKELRYYLID